MHSVSFFASIQSWIRIEKNFEYVLFYSEKTVSIVM